MISYKNRFQIHSKHQIQIDQQVEKQSKKVFVVTLSTFKVFSWFFFQQLLIMFKYGVLFATLLVAQVAIAGYDQWIQLNIENKTSQPLRVTGELNWGKWYTNGDKHQEVDKPNFVIQVIYRLFSLIFIVLLSKLLIANLYFYNLAWSKCSCCRHRSLRQSFGNWRCCSYFHYCSKGIGRSCL